MWNTQVFHKAENILDAKPPRNNLIYIFNINQAGELTNEVYIYIYGKEGCYGKREKREGILTFFRVIDTFLFRKRLSLWNF